jgi:hypothetical protein
MKPTLRIKSAWLGADLMAVRSSLMRRWWFWVAAVLAVAIAAVTLFAIGMHNADWNFEPNGHPPPATRH